MRAAPALERGSETPDRIELGRLASVEWERVSWVRRDLSLAQVQNSPRSGDATSSHLCCSVDSQACVGRLRFVLGTTPAIEENRIADFDCDL